VFAATGETLFSFYFVFQSTFYNFESVKILKRKLMKNKIGKIGGFILGVTGFLWLFKIIILENIPPSDELAPGMVVILAAMNGVLCAFIGSLIQKSMVKKRT
jgi:hypothetical protein